MTASDRRGW